MARLLATFLLLLSLGVVMFNHINGQDSEASGQTVQQASVTNTDSSIYDCSDVAWNGKDPSGVYTLVIPHVTSFQVYCDLSDVKGGWTVFQRRFDGSVNFYRSWDDYVNGFGEWNGEFWLGLEKVHKLTSYGSWKVRFDLEYWDGSSAYAEYSSFHIGDEASNYALTYGAYSGTAGDSLRYNYGNNGSAFSTYDNDNDENNGNCAARYHGAWWFSQGCDPYGHVNGQYAVAQYSSSVMVWYDWKNYVSLKSAKMMIKPYTQ